MAAFDAVAATQARNRQIVKSGDRVLRDELAELDALMRGMPSNLAEVFRQLPESVLKDRAKEHGERLSAGTTVGWPKVGTSPPDLVKFLAAHVRVLDELLSASIRYNRPPISGCGDYLNSEGTAYVVPSRRTRRLGGGDGDHLSYRRRGTLKHRIVSRFVGGLPVELVAVQDACERPPNRVEFGGALFPEFELGLTYLGDFFLADVDATSQRADLLDEQVDRLWGCDVMVWPELTMPPDAVVSLADKLCDRALASSDLPTVVVAGSWHVASAPGVARLVNRSTVLAGNGSHLGHCDKLRPYGTVKHGKENVDPGDHVRVYVCDRFIFAVAICKDYCDLAERLIWADLDIDCVLVPSMGEKTTMEGHVANAVRLSMEIDQQAFVVQQNGVPNSDPVGWILHPDHGNRYVDALACDAVARRHVANSRDDAEKGNRNLWR